MLCLGLLKMDLLCAEDSIVGSDMYLTYVGRAACNVIRSILADAVKEYDYTLNFEKYLGECNGKCPTSIIRHILGLRNLGYTVEGGEKLSLDTVEAVHADILKWFEERCSCLSINDYDELKGVEEIYNNMR